ncbi:MAG: Hpt domain-containing protein, partial [Actinomycetota bacterium]|nr:Hpt domain-containing protein [Actinomycetota bacterium]
MDGMDEIVQEFLVESHENLDQLDGDFVALEQTPHSRELLSSIFRTIHTIKGTSGFLAFNRLEAVTHVGENLLSRLRDGHMQISPETTDVLLSMVDTVRSLLSAIEATGEEGDVDVDGVVAALTAILDGRTSTAPAAVPAPAAPVAQTVEAVAESTVEQAAAPTPKPRKRAASPRRKAAPKAVA